MKSIEGQDRIGYKPPKVGDAIETDRHCPNCDYNLRGTRYGERCPECGEPIRIKAATARLAEASDVYLAGLQRGLTLTALAWAATLALWVQAFGGVVRPAMFATATASAILMIAAARASTGVPETAARAALLGPPQLQKGLRWGSLVAAAAVMTVPLGWQAARRGAFPIWLAALLLGGFATVAMQAAAAVYLSFVARGLEDDERADRFWNLAWGIALAGAFTVLFMVVAGWMSARYGAAPVCCMVSYFVVIGLAFAEVIFGVSVLGLRHAVAWARRYRWENEDRRRRMQERIRRAREGATES